MNIIFFSCLMQKTKGFYGSGFWPHTIHITTGVSLWASPAEFSKAQKLLHPAIASSVLQHVVISCQPCVRVETEKQRYGSHAEVIGGPNGDDGVPPMVIRVFSIWHQSYISGCWFGTFFIFHNNIWDNPSHWLIFFKMVKTTNQLWLV